MPPEPAPDPEDTFVPRGATVTAFASGRYVVRRLLGEGGQKVVYLVHDEVLDRDCALSMVKSELLEPDDLERLRREAQAMARLGAHSNIVSVFDFGDEDGKPYLVCEYVPAGELRRHLRDAAAPLPLERALAIAADIARALTVAHGRGVIHRDIKPANVWLCEDGSAKLGDFGLAFSLDRTRMTLPGSAMGTATYMAPEQARGEPVDARTDLYALGVVLYEMVCARPPFSGDDPLSVISQHTSVAPNAPVLHVADLPVALNELILRLLAKWPDGRPESASAVLEELRAITDGLRTTQMLPDREPGPEVKPEHQPAAPGFVGRVTELAQLTAALDRTIGGAGSLVMVVGEPGIGKTRLLEQFAAHARDAGARALVGRCYDGDWAPPFSPFVEAIKEHATTTSPQHLRAQLGPDAGVLARIVPALHDRLPNILEPPAIPAEGERYRLMEAVSDTLGRIAAERPLVLVLDDLHWADKGTIAMLQQVARTPATQHVLLLGAYRDVELDRTHPLADALAGLRREKHFERVLLHGLDGAEVAELLDTIAEQDVPAPLSEAIARETDGNPFFIKEVLLHLVEEGKIVQQDGSWTSKLSIAEMGIPEGVREVIGRRLSRVSETCGRMLTAASALTAGFSWEVISAISDAGDAALLDAVDEALGAQLIIEREKGRYDFTHALIRHTLYEELSTPRRVLLHRQIGEALERLYAHDIDSHVAELAHHYQEIGTEIDKTLAYSWGAGDQAVSSGAFDSAVSFYERAEFTLVHAPAADPFRHAELLLRLGQARYAAGLACSETFARAAVIALDANAFELAIRAALRDPLDRANTSNVALWPHDDGQMPILLDRALSGLSPQPTPLRACALAYRAEVESDRNLREVFRAQALEMARAVDEPLAIAYALYWQQFNLYRSPRDADRHVAEASEIIDIAGRFGDLPLVRAGHMWRAFSLLSLGDPGMDADLRTFHRMSDDLRVPQATWWSSVCMAMRTLMRGEFPEAEELIVQAAIYGQRAFSEVSPEVGDAEGVAEGLAVQLFALRRDQGRLHEILPAIQEAVEQATHATRVAHGTEVAEAAPAWRAALALAYVECDRLDDGRREFELALSGLDLSEPDSLFHFTTLSLVAEVCGLLGAGAPVRGLYSKLSPLSARMLHVNCRAALGSADRLLGVLASQMSEFADAEVHFIDAQAMHERMGARPWVARTRLDHARMLRKRDAAGDAARARELLQQALATAQEIGMAKVAADCEALLVVDG